MDCVTWWGRLGLFFMPEMGRFQVRIWIVFIRAFIFLVAFLNKIGLQKNRDKTKSMVCTSVGPVQVDTVSHVSTHSCVKISKPPETFYLPTHT